MNIDILYLGKDRDVYTRTSLRALITNTNWNRVSNFVLFDDGSKDETRDVMVSAGALSGVPAQIYDTNLGAPVAIMNKFLDLPGEEIFAKIDNDTMMPPGWLDAAVGVMEMHPELGILGLEPPQSRTPAPWSNSNRTTPPEQVGPFALSMGHTHGFAFCRNVGGIALIRRSIFGNGRMKPHSIYGGFGEWQNENKQVTCGWITPPIKVFVLDRLPMLPWRALSDSYLAQGLQRPWTNYSPADKDLWSWWDRVCYSQ